MLLLHLLLLPCLPTTLAFLPSPLLCCSSVEVAGNTTLLTGTYSLTTYTGMEAPYSGTEVLLRHGYLYTSLISYEGGRWVLVEVEGGWPSTSYASPPTEATCPEDAPPLVGEARVVLEVACARPPRHWMLVAIGIGVTVLVLSCCCCCCCCCCLLRRRSRGGRVHGGGEIHTQQQQYHNHFAAPPPYTVSQAYK